MDSHYAEASNEEELMTMINEGAEAKMTDKDILKVIEKTEVGENTYKWKYNELLDAYWKMKRSVSKEYKFGLILLDCRKFQELCIKQMEKLIKDFQNHLVDDFLEYLNTQLEKNKVTWERVNTQHTDIDKIIE